MSLSPQEEQDRLAKLRRYDILDSPPDGAFDTVTTLAATLCGTPMAVVSLVDEDRIWFKARYGIQADQVQREPGLCCSAMFSEGCYEVRDALAHPDSLNHSLVRGQFGLRFYAAAPLRTHDGARLGTLAVLDREPRELDPGQKQGLEKLAQVVVDEMELRLQTLEDLQRQEEGPAESGPVEDLVTICSWTRRVNHDGAWVPIETYLRDRYGVTVTHGISDDAVSEVRRELDPDSGPGESGS